jgi:hypothetical protein
MHHNRLNIDQVSNARGPVYLVTNKGRARDKWPLMNELRATINFQFNTPFFF